MAREALRGPLARSSMKLRLFPYLIAYFIGFSCTLASLAVILALRGNYVSVVAWNSLGLADLMAAGVDRVLHRQGTETNAWLTSYTVLSSLIVGGWTIPIYHCLATQETRLGGWILLVLWLLALLVWFPNPWENM